MKNVFIFLFLFPGYLFAQTNFTIDAYSYFNASRKTAKPVLVFIGTHSLTEKTSLIGFSLVSARFNEATLGINQTLTPHLSIAIMAGIENQPDLWRLKSSLVYTRDRVFLFLGSEYGASGLWYSSIGLYKVVDKKVGLGAGYFLRRFEGVGPRVEVTYRKISFYTMPFLYNLESEDTGGEIGIKANL